MFDENLSQDVWLSLLDSVPDEIVFCDLDHNIRFMNNFARKRYVGHSIDIGDSIFECHRQEESHRIIREGFDKLVAGEDEVFIYHNDRGVDTYLVAVRGKGRSLVGYYEWEKCPAGKKTQGTG